MMIAFWRAAQLMTLFGVTCVNLVLWRCDVIDKLCCLVWDLGAGTVLRRLQGHIGPIACVRLIGMQCFCFGSCVISLLIENFEGGNLLASGGTDKTVRIWDARCNFLLALCCSLTPSLMTLTLMFDLAAADQWAVSTLFGHTKRVDGLQIQENNIITSSRSASVR